MVIRDEETREMPHLGDIKSDGGQFCVDRLCIRVWLAAGVGGEGGLEEEDGRRRRTATGQQPGRNQSGRPTRNQAVLPFISRSIGEGWPATATTTVSLCPFSRFEGFSSFYSNS